MRIIYNSRAANDLNEILAYLAERNPFAADEQLSRFEAAVRRIGQNPDIGIVIRRNIRRIVVGKYLIVYNIGVETITIEYIRHSARRRPWESN
jgi:plasmid stabilization system protein ParE